MDYRDVIKNFSQIWAFSNLKSVIEPSVANIMAKSTDYQCEFCKIREKRSNVWDVGQQEGSMHN